MSAQLVRDMPAPEYHAAPALSASGAFMLASECPALYHAHSPFNPDALPDESNGAMNIGTAVHLAALEPDRLESRIVVVDAEDWRTKAAQEARRAACDLGFVPLLRKDRERVDHLAAALRANEYVADLLDGADTEVSFFWNADGIPCKARADIISRDGGAIGDLKASTNASPGFFQRQAFSAGHFLRSPFYRDGWQVVSGKRADYWYIIVAREEPHLVTIARLDERAIEWGRIMIRRAMILFRECRERGAWPPYCTEPATLSIPAWAEYRLADDEQEGRFSQDAIRAGMALVAP